MVPYAFVGYIPSKGINDIKGHVRNKYRPKGCIAEENIAHETIDFWWIIKKSMITNVIPRDEHEMDENEDGEALSGLGRHPK